MLTSQFKRFTETWQQTGWPRLVTYFAFSSITVQAAGFLSNLVWTWTLTVHDYAVLSLCSGAIAMGAVLADIGTSSALSYYWRRSLQTATSVDPYIVAIWEMRRRLLIAAGALVSAIIVLLLLRRSIDKTTIFFCVTLALATLVLQLRGGILSAILKLKGQLALALKADALAALVRLIVATTAALLAVGSAAVALAAGMLGAAAYLALVSTAQHPPAGHRKISREVMKDIVTFILPSVPIIILYAFKDQIILWGAWLGSGSVPVAEVFALGRLAIVFTVLGVFATAIIVPKLAQVTDDRAFARQSLAFAGLLALVCIAIVGLAAIFPSAALFVLGPNYRHLNSELVWSLAGAGMTTVALFLGQINRLRGWVRWEPFVAALFLIAIVAVLTLADFITSRGVLIANVWLSAFGLASVTVTTLSGMSGIYPSLADTLKTDGDRSR